MEEEKSDFRTGILPTESQIACICSHPISLIICHGELFIFFFSSFPIFFQFFFSMSLQLILLPTLLAAELKKTNNKPKRPSVKTLFGNITAWQFTFFLKHSLYIVVISCFIYQPFLVYYTCYSKVQKPIKIDLLWCWCGMGYWLSDIFTIRHPTPTPPIHMYTSQSFTYWWFFLIIVFFFSNFEFLCRREWVGNIRVIRYTCRWSTFSGKLYKSCT